jgi:hypothetical protein
MKNSNKNVPNAHGIAIKKRREEINVPPMVAKH